jgi:outer membrane lipoprotein-sorting protein
MNRTLFLLLLSLSILFPLSAGISLATSADPRVLAVALKMGSAFKSLEDYTCEVEQIFYKDGSENERSTFKFYFKKEKKIRVDFSHPYSSLTLIYIEGEDKATVIPFRSLPLLRFRFSINDSKLKTRAGQQIDQTDMGCFIHFVLKNLESIPQGDSEFREHEEGPVFSLWALDYVNGKILEKYRIHLSQEVWLPIRIERFDLKGKPIEITVIKNYAVNTHPGDKLFHP